MKKVKKIITGFLMVFIFMAMVLPMTTVKASEEKEAVEKRMYTVTFRAGNIACFDIDKITVSEGMEVTKNYIKVKVAKGDTLAFTVPGWESDAGLTSWFSNCLHYEKEAAYGLKDFNGVVGTAVERNTEYVLDYKRLIDPVSYTVSFIDSQTKEQIAAPQITYVVHKLIDKGIPLDPDITTVEEAKNAILKIWHEKNGKSSGNAAQVSTAGADSENAGHGNAAGTASGNADITEKTAGEEKTC